VTEWLAALTVPDGFAIEDYHAEMVGLRGACRPDATRPAHDRTDATTENA